LTIALSVASAPTTHYSLALSLHADLPVVLTIVHFDGTSILSLHTIYEDLKLGKERRGEQSEKLVKSKLTGHVLANGSVNCLAAPGP
jgi:hypothetical protein